ncbi:MAG: hypothetical protein M1526_05320 [Candidatus Thermoplasmatota archaeon]|jgi:hypothetical protein|nr:hypothetical protein [Candidatus Thermoplasmatota archaeon]MCL5681279.1 hypothetical protein [Candidatus Thermoplasmatota archaeon]
MSALKREHDTISGKDPGEVKSELIEKTSRLYGQLARSFEDLSTKTTRPDLKKLLIDFAYEAQEDRTKIETAITEKELEIEVSDISYEMFDHLEENYGPEDSGEKIIKNAINLSNNLRNVFSIISREYTEPSIKEMFDKLQKHEVLRKNELEELYDEIVTKGEW